MDWLAKNYRLTFLTQDPFVTEDVDWWEKIIKNKPDTVTKHPNSFGSILEGIYDSNKLKLDIKPERIDWNYTVIEKPGGSPVKSIKTLGIFNKSIISFKKLIEKWFKLEDLPLINRMAFGANLLIPVDDEVKGYKILNDFLPSVTLKYKEPSDFLFQNNRIRKSETDIENLKINRLSKWSVTRFRSFLISAQADTAFNYMDTFACNLDLDINTLKLDNPIPDDSYYRVFNELVDLGLEIAEKGDVE